jgi:hypothetical protein
MSPSGCETTPIVSIVCSITLGQLPPDFKSLEEQIVETVQESAREFYAQAVAAFQERWLHERRAEFQAVRWRLINQITPFGLLRLPVRVVRRRRDLALFFSEQSVAQTAPLDRPQDRSHALWQRGHRKEHRGPDQRSP